MRQTPLVVALLSMTLLAACIEIPRTPLSSNADATATPDATGAPDGVATPDAAAVPDVAETAVEDIEPEPPQATVRLVHAVTDLGPVDVYVAGDEAPLIEGLGYTEVSEWLTVEAADYVFEFRPEGAGPSDPPVFVSNVTEIAEGPANTVVAAGLKAGVDQQGVRLVTIREGWGANLASRARLRLVHAGMDAPSLTVRGLEGSDFTVDRFDASESLGVPIPTEGGTRLELRDGTDTLTVFTAPPFADGDEILLVASGLLGSLARQSDGFALLAINPQGSLGLIRQDPQVFTVHGARDAPTLENCTGTGGTAVAANIKYGEVQSAFVSPGEYNFEVHAYPSGCTGALNPGGTASGPLEAGERYMLLLSGEVTPAELEPGIQVAPFKEQFSLDDPEVAQLRFIHGASFTQIYIGNVIDGAIDEEDVFTDPIAWRAESDEVALPEGAYVLGAADANGEPEPPLAPIVTFDVSASPGARVWGVVTGDPFQDDDDDEFLQLMVVNTSVPGWEIALVDVN